LNLWYETPEAGSDSELAVVGEVCNRLQLPFFDGPVRWQVGNLSLDRRFWQSFKPIGETAKLIGI
jgi:hypothetical protein